MAQTPQREAPACAKPRGFTMIELIVVMAVIGLLLTLAVPRYMDSLERGKDQVMAHDLAAMRKAIDQYYGDRGAYPERLEDLVTRRYLRSLPVNPHTDAVDWIVIPPPGGKKGQVYDVRAPDRAAADLPADGTVDAGPSPNEAPAAASQP